MRHLSDSQIDRYCMNHGSPEERDAIATHTLVCAECMARILEADTYIQAMRGALECQQRSAQ
jgi:hypothetical protein